MKDDKTQEQIIFDLQNENQILKAKIKSQSFGLGMKFYSGNYKLVTHLYSKELTNYSSIKCASIEKARRVNKGKKKCYPYLYVTNVPTMMKALNISKVEAIKTIRFLNTIEAWELVKRNSSGDFTYRIGDRELVKYKENGKWEKAIIDKFCLSLYKNTTALRFYKNEIDLILQK